MKHKETLGLILFLLLMVAGINSSHARDRSLFHQDEYDIHLDLLLTLGSLEDDLLFQWVGVNVDRLGHIYVTDALDYSIKKFSWDGNLLKKSGGRGQGPGEFMAPRLLDASEKYLYVTDQLNSGIQVFDKDLQYVHRIPIQTPVSDFQVLHDEAIAVASLRVFSPLKINIYNASGRINRTLTVVEHPTDVIMDQFNFVCDDSGNIYVVYLFKDKIEKFDNRGKRLWSIGLVGIRTVKKKEISGYVLPTEILYKDVDLDSRGNVFILGGHSSSHPSRDVFVLNPEGFLLTSFTLPDTSHCLYIDEKDCLYTRANAGITLKKFKMRYRF